MSKEVYYRDGTSHVVPEGYRICPNCHGKGEEPATINVGGMIQLSGQGDTQTCGICYGNGYVEKENDNVS